MRYLHRFKLHYIVPNAKVNGLGVVRQEKKAGGGKTCDCRYDGESGGGQRGSGGW